MRNRIICHRANISGSDSNRENRLFAIVDCLSAGFDVEIDVRMFGEDLYLGHDERQEKIDLDFLLTHKDMLWVHCKDFESLNYLTNKTDLNYFYHDKDEHTLTSWGYIWTYPLCKVGPRSVIVCKNEMEVEKYMTLDCHRICSDWVVD
jgi:hypothetical protein